MSSDTTGVERALGAIGSTFRLSRLYPPTHPAVVEAMRQVTVALPALAAVGTVEWKIGATGLHWHGQHLLPRNAQVTELAGLLFARGIRIIQINPGITAEHVLALFAVATGSITPDDATLGQITLSLSRRLRSSSANPQRAMSPPPADITGSPAAPPVPPPSSAPVPSSVLPASPQPTSQADTLGRRASTQLRLDAVPADIEVKRALAELKAASTPEAQRGAVDRLQALTPTLLGMRDVATVAEAIYALDGLLGTAQDANLVAAIGTAAGALANESTVKRMFSRMGESRVPPAEREVLVAALGALASLSVGPLLNAYMTAPVDLREPHRAVIRKAGDRALEVLQERLGDKDPGVAAAAAELVGSTGSPQAIPLLVPLLRHPSEFVREAAITGLGEIGGREISRPIMPALKDESMGVRAAAARAIAVAGDPAATTVLVRRLEQEEDEGVLADLLRAIGRLGAQEALEVLARHAEPGGMLKRRSPTVRAAAVEGLACLSSREARGFVELYTHDKEPAVRKAAEKAVR